MTKRKVKEELKKPDFMLVTLERLTTWIREHLRLCIVGAAVLVAFGLVLTAYKVYEAREDDKLQYQLAEGVNDFRDYTVNGNGQALQKAESILKEVSVSRRKGLHEIAKLYLAKIYYAQGKREEARSIYLDLKSRASNSMLKKLAEAGLQQIGQPAK